MTSLGFRCSNSDYHFAVLEGSRDKPVLVAHGRVSLPSGFGRSEVVSWMIQEVHVLLDRYGPKTITMRASEVSTTSTSLVERIELEAAVFGAAGLRGMKAVFRKRRVTLAKDLGLKGKAKALVEDLDTSVLPDYGGLSEKTREAVIAAWSEL